MTFALLSSATLLCHSSGTFDLPIKASLKDLLICHPDTKIDHSDHTDVANDCQVLDLRLVIDVSKHYESLVFISTAPDS